jgi:DNA-binding NtrC family response regulator
MVITACGNNSASAALSAGANYALSKPLEFDVLTRSIERLLSKPGVSEEDHQSSAAPASRANHLNVC